MGNLDHGLAFVVNLSLHVFILLTFLTVFFFLYISKLTKSHVEHELESLVSKEVNQLLVRFNQKDTDRRVDWSRVALFTSNLKNQYREELPELLRNNEKLLKSSVCFLVVYATVLLFVTTYLYYKGVNLGLKYIFAENFIIFFFVGIVEFLFFSEIAAKYIPVTPDTATSTVVARIKERLMNLG